MHHLSYQSALSAAHTDQPVVAPLSSTGVLSDDLAWLQVNDGAFGQTDPYSNEEAFEGVVFNDQLYLGMEADNSQGARLWRTRAGVSIPTSQNDWEEVAADNVGNPFGNPQTAQNDHVDSLCEFQGMLYASTANRSGIFSGTLVYRNPSGDALNWTRVVTPGFGDSQNTNFKDMQVFDGQLCGGTANAASGAEVWCTPDGTTWKQVNRDGFGDPTSVGIWSAHVFHDALYMGVRRSGDRAGGMVLRTESLETPVTWSVVYTGTTGSKQVTIVGALNEYLYLANPTPGGITIWRSESGNSGTWQRVSPPGMDNTPENAGTVTDGAVVYHDALYVAVYNLEEGVSVWRTTGILDPASGWVDWQQIGTHGLGDPQNRNAQLFSFREYLYAWTSNYTSGQQVRQVFVAPPFFPVYLPYLSQPLLE
jgi:hypothetical protein